MPVALALRIAVTALTLLAWGRRVAARRMAFLGSAAASILSTMAAAAALRPGAASHGILFVHRASQFAFSYALDGLAAWFLLVLGIVAVPIALFSLRYIGQAQFEHRSVFVGTVFNVLVGAIELVFVAGDAITFLFAWELMTLASAALVATEHEVRENRRAAYLYLVMSHVGTGCLIAAFLVLASVSGSSSFSILLSGHL